jgi:hypothetical protein
MESKTNGTTQGEPGRFRRDALHILVLYNLAFAVRLYDVLGRHPTLFVAKRSQPIDVLLLVVVLSIAAPLACILLEKLASLLSERLRRFVHAAFVFVFVAVIALPIVKEIDAVVSLEVFVWAAIAGGLGVVVYTRYPLVRTALTILWPAALLFPALFLWRSPVFARNDADLSTAKIGKPAPIVMIVFDEFCGVSLMDEQRQIDPVRYPNFAALAESATWFRNATTMSMTTKGAVPSMLTGQYPKYRDTPPTLAEYPQNLFTLLGRRYEMNVAELITHLCPDKLLRYPGDRAGVAARLGSLLLDAGVVQLHILFRTDVSYAMPEIGGRWGNFLGQDYQLGVGMDYRPRRTTDRVERVEEFIAQIRPAEKPALYFLHVELPHVPYLFLPSGKPYDIPLTVVQRESRFVNHGMPGFAKKNVRWGDDAFAVEQCYQRYLLQVACVDRLIGVLIRQMKSTGLFDESLIVLTADHGVSMRPSDARREVTATNFPDIMSIPLLIKAPHQQSGLVSDRNVQSADLLPTLADILDVTIPWKTRGISAWNPDLPEPASKEIGVEGRWEHQTTYEGSLPQKFDTLDNMLALFGSGSPAGELYRFGPHKELVGRKLADLTIDEQNSCPAVLTLYDDLSHVDLGGARLPCYLGGSLEIRSPLSFPLELAIAVNGEVQATTRTYLLEGLRESWTAMIPEACLQSGANDLRVLVVTSAGDQTILRPFEKVTVAPDSAKRRLAN